jgi:hypothetical protein
MTLRRMTMEEAVELDNYLSLSFKSPEEQEYIEFLWDAFQSNYQHGKCQFAFLAGVVYCRIFAEKARYIGGRRQQAPVRLPPPPFTRRETQ